MANKAAIVLRSPTLDAAVKTYSIFATPPRRSGRTSLSGHTIAVGGKVSAAEYNGPFKLVLKSPTTVDITYPGSADYCGFTDIPGLSSIPKVENMTISGEYVYIAFFYAAGQYTYAFSSGSNPPENAVFYATIGYINAGKVNQILVLDYASRLTFGNDWVLE